ncbi:uncharacterized protein [Henckelia pumila]|uniref:uncharacterized protein n=1 Tax=Henckelia pumila TaxID=405737 RepID=UPI003C6E0038
MARTEPQLGDTCGKYGCHDEEHAADVEKEKEVEEKKPELEGKQMYKTPLPYTQIFKKKVLDEQFAKFLDIFKKLQINISFADVLLQMPNYAKLLREVMFKKRKMQEFEIANMTEEILGLVEVNPTTIALQLADKSIKYPRGIIEDVLEDENMPLILGRPFLATAEAKIDVKKGALTMGVEGKKVTFNVFKEADKPSTEKVFLVEQSKKIECRCKVVSAVKLPREINPKLVKIKKKKKRSKFKRVVEFVWRVKENGKTSNKSREPG